MGLGKFMGEPGGQRIADLSPEQPVSGIFVVRQKRLRPFRNKPGHYLDLVLEDSTGKITARMWDRAEEAAPNFEEGQAVRVEGKVELYQDSPQVIISSITPARPEEVGPDVFPPLPQSKRPVPEMLAELRKIIGTISHTWLKKLMDAFLKDEQFMDRYTRCPGAKDIHHAYIGGLLEHTLEICQICEGVCKIYPQLDRDMLLTGALLHDIGKTEELQFQTAFSYTDEGRLLGHTLIGIRIISDKMDEMPGFPDDSRVRLLHIIASHHGDVDPLSPRHPMTAEACALHYAENLDAQVNRFVGLIEEARASGKSWTEYQRSLNRSLFSGPGQLPEAPEGDEP
jgi:3'-5' exoribonuclease